MTAVIRVLCWNIGLREKPMQVLTDSGCDVALIQEAPLCVDSWEQEHYDRGARICRLSNRVDVIGFRNIPLGRRPGPDEFAVSAAGTIAAARIIPENGLHFIAISLYARWEKPHPDTPTTWGVGYADAMAHRAISDLSAFIGHKDPATHRILVAGDFNLIHGATEQNHLALPERDRSVFARLQSLGFEFVGPQHPNGRMTSPTPQGAFRRIRRTFQRTTPHASSQARQQTSSTTYSRRGGSTGTCGHTRSMNRNSGVRAIIAGS